MNNSLYWAWAIKNSICVICWVALAIIFNKWWIALFGLLFITSLKTSDIRKFHRICDKCGTHSEYADSPDKALEMAKAAGWLHCENGNDYCPDCISKMKG